MAQPDLPIARRYPHGEVLTPAVALVVLDTNVCLDLLLFRDPAVAALAAALQSGRVAAVSDRHCREEWRRVLGYPLLALPAPEQRRLLADYDDRVQLVEVGVDVDAPAAAALPRCADPDDQKFLQLAQCSGARWLLSRDRALLALSRRVRREHGFEVLTPRQWASCGHGFSCDPPYNSKR